MGFVIHVVRAFGELILLGPYGGALTVVQGVVFYRLLDTLGILISNTCPRGEMNWANSKFLAIISPTLSSFHPLALKSDSIVLPHKSFAP
jgi:hypothetical protein